MYALLNLEGVIAHIYYNISLSFIVWKFVYCLKIIFLNLFPIGPQASISNCETILDTPLVSSMIVYVF